MLFYYDPTYLLVIIGAILSLMASAKVNSTYKKYSRIANASGLTGAQTAQILLGNHGIRDTKIVQIGGQLSDHYNPSTDELGLSSLVCNSASVASIAIAAHECGHVMQKKENYLPLSIRASLVPLASFGSNAGLWIVMIGFIFGLSDLFVKAGILLFSFGVLFQLVTLPVEFDASRRGVEMLRQAHLIGADSGYQKGEDESGVKEMLTAAALTYVAAAAASVLSLLRLIMMNDRRSRRRW